MVNHKNLLILPLVVYLLLYRLILSKTVKHRELSMNTSTETNNDYSHLSTESFAKPQLSEIALAVCINGISQSVMMVSDTDLEDFAVGFALSEGFIKTIDEVRDITVEKLNQGKQINLTVSSQAEYSLKKRRRTLAGPTGCGLCGLESINEVMCLPTIFSHQQIELESSQNQKQEVPNANIILSAKSSLDQLQQKYNGVRGNHCAAYFDLQGNNIGYREDVGRHSALDKLIGYLAKNTVETNGFVMLSSRCSHDLVAKTARAKLPILITLAQPTNLAVSSALQTGLALFSFHQGQLKRFA